MNGKYLLDTNIVIALLAGETATRNHLAEANEVFIPCVVVGELCYGAQKSGRPQENLARIDEFVASCAVLVCDLDTARQYGKIKNSLRIKGRPTPENDIWIASITFQFDLTLVTRDRHFTEIDNLKTEVW